MSKAAKWSRRWLLGLIAASCLLSTSSLALADESSGRLQPLSGLRHPGDPDEQTTEAATEEVEVREDPALPEPAAISTGRMQLRRGRPKESASFAQFSAPARGSAPARVESEAPQLRTGRGTRSLLSIEQDAEPSVMEGASIGDQSILAESDVFLDPLGHGPCLDGCSECMGVAPCFEGCGYFGGVELLMWWRKSRPLPPLVSTDVIGPGAPGVVLFGDENVGGDARPGGRVTLGKWLTPQADWGVMARFYALGEDTVLFNSRNTNAATVGRPVIEVDPTDALFNQEALLQVDGFAGFNGAALARSESEVYGGDVLLRKSFYQDGCSRGDFLFGYRAARINEELVVSNISEVTMNDLVVDVLGIDSFKVRNEFHGFDLGVLVETQQGAFSLELLAKVALGDMTQRVSIQGFSQFQTGSVVETFPEGLLVKGTNSGEYKRNKFAVSPEIAANVRCRLNNCLDLTFGYSFLYWTGVVQPGDLVDRFVNSSQEMGGMLIGDPRPGFRYFDTNYWVHGLNVGLTARF